MKQHELAAALNIKGSERAQFRHILFAMERDGQVVCLRKNRWALPVVEKEITGVVRVNQQGFGFLTQDAPGQPDVFIPEEGMANALDGDRVAVTLARESAGPSMPSGRGRRTPEPDRLARGRIARVLQRGRPDLVGLLRKMHQHWYVVPDNPRLRHHVRVEGFADGLAKPAEFHKVVVRLGDASKPHLPLSGMVTEDLGPADQAGVDVLSVIRDHGIDPKYPETAAREARRHSPALPKSEFAGRQDLRRELSFTVDPEDAKDHDDAVSLQKTPDGHWRLDVHIADVAAFVPPGSAVDQEALHRGNSVYLVDRAIPMLPPYLTSDICSLVPDQDRLTHTVRMVFDTHGRMLHSKTFPSVIRSAARLTYDQVQQYLDHGIEGSMSAPVRHAVKEMNALGVKLRERRMAGGSIDLTMAETRIQLDDGGTPIRIIKRSAAASYQLIEEFMLVANVVVAEVLARAEVPAIYRIHEAPDEDQFARMGEDLAALGIRKSPTTRNQINEICRRAAGTPLEYAVSLACLRNLKRAVYSSTLREHFGLAYDCYTHFTSPIRRYPDLVVHRMLRALEEHRPGPYSHDDVARIAAQCSWTEQNAAEAEEDSVELKRLEYFEAELKAGRNGPHAGIVLSVNPRGLIVELIESLQRGLLPFAALSGDFYAISENGRSAKGRRHGKTWFVGQTLSVRVNRVDRVSRRVDLLLEGGEDSERRKKEKRGRSESKPAVSGSGRSASSAGRRGRYPARGR